MEIWKKINGYEDYEISNTSKIRSIDRIILRSNGKKQSFKSRIMIQSTRTNGYLCVGLTKNKKLKSFTVHRLLALNFIENKNNLPAVNHKNGIKTDNSISNLEWVSNRENCCHKTIKMEKSSKYIGVSYENGVWKSTINFNKKRIRLGSYVTEDEAYSARKEFESKNNIINKYL